jgi:CRP-like cAMP-binding protein
MAILGLLIMLGGMTVVGRICVGGRRSWERALAKDVLERQSFSTGEVIFKKGENPRAAYLIQAGSVKIVVGEGEGEGEETTVVETLVAGDLVGEMALVDAQPRSATAQAKQPTTVVVITAIEFAKRMEKSDPFMRSMVRMLTKRLRNMTEASSEDG